MTGRLHAIAEPPDGSIEVVAAWYAQNFSALKAIASAKYIVERRLRSPALIARVQEAGR